jgi:hypothetical protein
MLWSDRRRTSARTTVLELPYAVVDRMTRVHDARDALAVEDQRSARQSHNDAFFDVEPSFSVLDARTAKLIASLLGRIISALRAGAQSSRDASGGLTYADGWAAAASLAGLVSAETVSDLMSGAIE